MIMTQNAIDRIGGDVFEWKYCALVTLEIMCVWHGNNMKKKLVRFDRESRPTAKGFSPSHHYDTNLWSAIIRYVNHSDHRPPMFRQSIYENTHTKNYHSIHNQSSIPHRFPLRSSHTRLPNQQDTIPTIWIWRCATAACRWRWDWPTASRRCISSRPACVSTIISGTRWPSIGASKRSVPIPPIPARQCAHSMRTMHNPATEATQFNAMRYVHCLIANQFPQISSITSFCRVSSSFCVYYNSVSSK